MAKAASSGRTIPIWVLRVFLGLAFLTIGGAKLTGSLGMVGWFAQIGWGQWFRYLTGLLDIIGLGGHPKPAIGGHLKSGQRDS
jgi:putative oxidoreductase